MTEAKLPEGLSLYIRNITKKRHGNPKELAKKLKDHGTSWAAIGGPWHDDKGQRFINKANSVKPYMEALEASGIQAWVWGYPWTGNEEQFVQQAKEFVPDGIQARLILDDELGANPHKISKGEGKQKANERAYNLIKLVKDSEFDLCILSTFGSAESFAWFPLHAYTRALNTFFPFKSAIGGQTYTDDRFILPSIKDFNDVIEDEKAHRVLLCPNFGAYGRKKNGKARPKTVDEFRSHMMHFIQDPIDIHRMIGWCFEFMNDDLWNEFHKFAELMQRGGCVL